MKGGGCSDSLYSNLAGLGAGLSTLAAFLKCVENEHAVMTNMYTNEVYVSKQPTLEQRNDLKEFMANGFFSGLQDNICFTVPASVQHIYQVWEYKENNIAYCMLIEKNATFSSRGYNNRMTFGWPIVVRPKFVNLTTQASFLHFSAPHIVSEPDAVSSGATLFVSTKALSYIVQTRVRDALAGDPTCLYNSQATGITDGLNSKDELFYDMNLGLISWQLNTSSLPSPCTTANCGFIQWYGTSVSSCYDGYISIGSGNESDYQYSPPNPAVSIHNYFNSFTSIYDAHNPYTGDECGLWGKDNIVGRYLNFLSSEQICDISVQPAEFSQLFISIQASPDLRKISNSASAPLNLMVNAIKQTYDGNKINV